MPFDLVQGTRVYTKFKEHVYFNPAFKMNIVMFADVELEPLPIGTCVDEDYMYFKDINNVFWAVRELYTRTHWPLCLRGEKIVKALRLMETEIIVNDLAVDVAAFHINSPSPKDTRGVMLAGHSV